MKFHRDEFDYAKFEHLLVDVEDGIARFRINRPERRNALANRTFWEIVELGEMIGEDDTVRVVVGYGDDRAFSSGGDLGGGRDDAEPAPEPSRAQRLDQFGVSRVALAISELDKPTIAAINGACAGAGMGYACSFDIRILGPGARFITAFVRRALAPDTGLSWFLPRLVGPALATELLMTSREVGAEEAVRIGLGNRLVDDPLPAALELAEQLRDAPPIPVMWSKREVQAALGNTLREQLRLEWVAQREASSSRDVREGFQAFLEKRQPNFTGE